MATRILVPLCWTFWSILAVGLLYWFVRLATEKTSSPEVGPGAGLFLVLFLAALLAGAGFLLAWAARKQSTGWLITLAIVLAYPIVPAVARPIVLARKERRWAADAARVGDFRDPALAPMAEAIRNKDAATLTRLLGGKAPPAGKDRAGNDLLAYAVHLVRNEDGSVDVVRALLDAGADPRTSRTGEGVDPLNHVMDVSTPATREVALLLLEHGADPNAADPSGDTPLVKVGRGDVEILRQLVERGANIDQIQAYGVPAIVRFMGSREVEAVLYLIEKGARLDISNADGLSVDYYLKSWKQSYYADGRPEGWERVVEAVEKRRAAR